MNYFMTFNNVGWDKFWFIRTVMEVPEHLTHSISRLKQDTLAYIRMDGSHEYILEKGIYLGCVLSPQLILPSRRNLYCPGYQMIGRKE